MKIKALSRSSASHLLPGSAITQQPRNLDPALHPFERAREYTRALNATKTERMFAKPFLGQLGNGHVDGVYILAKDPNSLNRFSSGSGDGVVKVWDLTTREELWQTQAHTNTVKGLSWTHDGLLLSCGGSDRSVVLHEPSRQIPNNKPIATYNGKHSFTSLSQHSTHPSFAASSSAGITIFDISRNIGEPIQNISWPTSVDTVNTVCFNPIEGSILASAATDRSIALYDLRTSSPIAKTTLTLATNAISWNPMEAFNFATANEDHNIYLFDTRNMSRTLNVLKDHVAAVMDVEFSPTGEDLVSASYDRTIRMWSRSSGHSKDIYHSKRMQRVFSAKFSPDNRYIFSGSDDGNVRLWRAQASARAGIVSAKQRQAEEYQSAVRQRYAHMPQIKRISRHRHVPKAIKKAAQIKNEELASFKKKEGNKLEHGKKSDHSRLKEREKMILYRE